MPGPHDFSVRNLAARLARSRSLTDLVDPPCNHVRAHDTFASTASHPNVRDDRDTPLVRDETARTINLIWGEREAEYFCAGDSTEKSKIARDLPVGQSLKARIITSDLAE